MILFRVRKEEYNALKEGKTDIYSFERCVDEFRGDSILIACENTLQEAGEVSKYEVLASRFDKETNMYTLRVKFERVCPVEILYDFSAEQYWRWMKK